LIIALNGDEFHVWVSMGSRILGSWECNWNERYWLFQLFSLISFINHFEMSLRR